MRMEFWRGTNAGTDRSVKHLIFDQDPISTGEHHEMLLFIAVKVHWRAATGSCNGFNNRICPICICAGKPHCNTFTSSPFIPRARAGDIEVDVKPPEPRGVPPNSPQNGH